MKTAIVYYSKHHENTKKLIDAIASENEITPVNVLECSRYDLSEYDLIGGIAKGHPDEKDINAAVKFYRSIINR